MKKWLIFSLLLVGLLSGGCVSQKQPPPEYHPKLGVARSANGNVNFAFTSREGYLYSIYYEDRDRGEAQRKMILVPDCGDIRGTGETIEIEKRFRARGPLPKFMLRHALIN